MVNLMKVSGFSQQWLLVEDWLGSIGKWLSLVGKWLSVVGKWLSWQNGSGCKDWLSSICNLLGWQNSLGSDDGWLMGNYSWLVGNWSNGNGFCEWFTVYDGVETMDWVWIE